MAGIMVFILPPAIVEYGEQGYDLNSGAGVGSEA